jgi:hypothetical protein
MSYTSLKFSPFTIAVLQVFWRALHIHIRHVQQVAHLYRNKGDYIHTCTARDGAFGKVSFLPDLSNVIDGIEIVVVPHRIRIGAIGNRHLELMNTNTQKN